MDLRENTGDPSVAMSVQRTITSGGWRDAQHMSDYRSEWLSEVLVERTQWTDDAPRQMLRGMPSGIIIADRGYIWLRFWFKKEEQLLEKYFDPRGQAIGTYVPVCGSWHQQSNRLATISLLLALWIDPTGRVTVLGEHEFDQVVEDRVLSPVDVEHAEYRIRQYTTLLNAKQFPPALVRNFAITTG